MMCQKTKQSRLILVSNCAVYGKKRSTFIKNKKIHNFNNIWNYYFKMIKIINSFLLTGDKYIPKLHLKQPEFTYSACGQFTKHRERSQKFREARNVKFWQYRFESENYF